MTDQLRTEVNLRLDSVETHLGRRVPTAPSDSANPEAFLGVPIMTRPAIGLTIGKALVVCTSSN
jgi:hypothetical protein